MSRIKNKGGYGVLDVKTKGTSRGYEFHGTLTFQGKKIATFHDKGDGGAMNIWYEKNEDGIDYEKDFRNFIEKNIEEIGDYSEGDALFIAMLADEDEIIQMVYKNLEKKTYFYVKSDVDGEDDILREIAHPYSKLKEYFKTNYTENPNPKAKLVGVCNELFAEEIERIKESKKAKKKKTPAKRTSSPR